MCAGSCIYTNFEMTCFTFWCTTNGSLSIFSSLSQGSKILHLILWLLALSSDMIILFHQATRLLSLLKPKECMAAVSIKNKSYKTKVFISIFPVQFMCNFGSYTNNIVELRKSFIKYFFHWFLNLYFFCQTICVSLAMRLKPNDITFFKFYSNLVYNTTILSLVPLQYILLIVSLDFFFFLSCQRSRVSTLNGIYIVLLIISRSISGIRQQSNKPNYRAQSHSWSGFIH